MSGRDGLAAIGVAVVPRLDLVPVRRPVVRVRAVRSAWRSRSFARSARSRAPSTSWAEEPWSRSVPSMALGGRGLPLLDAMTFSWGHLSNGTGKAVWALIPFAGAPNAPG